ncbi:MAG TPA: ATP-binding protein [Rhizomicrobium sp.]|jgi:signal transduction histidine kinase
MTAEIPTAGLRRGMPSPSLGMLTVIAAVIALSSYACLELTSYSQRVAAIWISNAILLAFLLKYRYRDWPSVLLAGFAGHLATDLATHDGVLGAVLLPLANTIEILAIALPLRAWALDREFARSRSLIVFYALAVGPAPMASALVASVFFEANGAANLWSAAVNWYLADALGLVVIVPLLMTVRLTALRDAFGRKQVIGTLLLVGVVLATAGVNWIWRGYPFAFLFFPAVVLLTFQRGFAGGAIGLVVVASYMMAPVLLGDPSSGLRQHTLREQVMIVEIFIAVTGLSVVLLGAALEERKRLAQRLAAATRFAEAAREEAVVARDAAVQANRTKSMFLANMSHELRTPLNAVIGFANIMNNQVFGPLGNARYTEYATHIQDAGQHLLDLINNILDMSKIEAGKMELEFSDFSIDVRIRECMELLHERAAQGEIELAADLPPGSLTIHADQRAVRQILLNLLSNAIKFTPERGRIVTRARVVEGRLVLSVSDTGIGIPPDRIDDLGNPFVQLRNTAGESHTGTGLGLALVRTLAELHGGTMHIESVAGAGTKVTVEFPTRAAQIQAA